MRRLLILLLLVSLSFQAGFSKENEYPIQEAPLLTKTIFLIKRNYLEPSRIDANAMFEAALSQIQKTVPEILAKCEKPKFCSVTVHQGIKRFHYPGTDLDTLKDRLKEVFRFMALHADPDTEVKEIEYAGIQGLLNELDPHSSFFSPEEYEEFQIGTEGEFGGLGIVISLKEGRLTVMSPLEDTPAWRAKIKAGDHITEIDDESTINMSLTEAVGKLRGPVGSRVVVKIEREGLKSPLHISLKRAVIRIDAVQSKLVKTPDNNNVGFIRVKSFQQNTESDFHKQLTELTKEENRLKGIILDLRNNPGGLLDQSITLADAFLKKGTIVSTVGRNGKVFHRTEAEDDGYEKEVPLIVLVNQGSASASEIVAGALKNNNRAVIIGHQTFGKGSVQSVFNLPLGAALKLTVAQYLTPGEESIQSVGITPDIELVPLVVDKEHLDVMENVSRSEKDLEKHLQGNKQPNVQKPAYRLRFLAPTPDEEEKNEYSGKVDLQSDIDAEIALGMLDIPASAERTEMITRAGDYIRKRTELENGKAAAAFKTLGIDWSLDKGGTKLPSAQIAFRLLHNGEPVQSATAGEKITLQASVKNIGKTPFFQLAAQSEAEPFLFKNLEFAFGKIKPGETKTWSTKIEVPIAALSNEIEFALNFREAEGKTPETYKTVIPLHGLRRPRFAHRYQLPQGWQKQLKKGKSVDLTVNITNIGRGEAKKPLVALINKGGRELFIEKGRVTLPPLKERGSAEAKLRFHIDPSWKGKRLDVELSVVDSELIAGTQQKIVFDLERSLVDPPAGKEYSPPSIKISSSSGKVGTSLHILKGLAEDDRMVRDLFIFLGEEKTFYQTNSKEEKTMLFQTALRLKEGSNTIAITARDNYNLTSNQYITLYFDPELSKKKVAKNHNNKGKAL